MGLTENTLVVFTSDHGYNEGRHGVNTKGNGHWIVGGVRGPKRPNMWETSVTVPLVMRWPGVIQPGTRIDHPVSNIDMYRFALGAMGIPVPADAAAHGLDYSPLLRGETLPPRDALFGQYDLHNSGLAYLRMIRAKRYKLIKHFHANMMDEFYDLENDPDETRNLMRKNQPGSELAGIAEDLDQQLIEWMKSIDDPLLRDTY